MTESSFTYNADKRFVRQVFQASVPKKLRQLNFVVAGLAALVSYSILADEPWLALAAGIGGAIAAFIAIGAQKPLRDVQKSLNAQFSSLPEPAEITVQVNDAGMRFTNARGSQDVPWSHIASVHRTRSIWFVHTTEGTTLPLPAAAIPPDAATAIASGVPTVTGGT